MEAIIVIFVISIAVSGGFLFLFMKAVEAGQYDDTSTPASRILFPDSEQDIANEKVK